MPEIKQLYPPRPEPVRRPFRQCSAHVEPPYHVPDWRKRRYAERGLDPERCVKCAQYEIDGKPYCTTHAGKIALCRWVKGDLR